MSPKLLFSQLHEKIAEKFRNVSFKLYERMPADQATYLYWLLGATALGGVVDAPSATAVLLALGKVVGELGMGALSSLLDDFRNKKDDDERVRLLRESAENSEEVRKALDLLLKKSEALNAAQVAYQQEHPTKEEQQQFAVAMQQAIARAGSSLKISKSRVQGQAVAIGHKARAQNISAKHGGLAVGKIKAERVVIQTTAEKSSSTRPEASARKNYLESMRNACNLLPLAALADDRDPHSEREAAMSLSQVYIDLNTTTPKESSGRGQKRKTSAELYDREQEPLTALEAALHYSALVLLGEPGSGKSSFTNNLLYLCAGYVLDKKKNRLPKAWPVRNLMPVRLALRELAVDLTKAEAETWLQLSADARDRKLLDLIFAHLKTRLQECHAAGFRADLQTHLHSGECLVVLDGLDEVAVAQRSLVRAALTALRERLGPNRYIVTCRTRSWDDKHPLPAFHTATLAHFTDEQVQQFVQNWYGALRQAGQFTQAEAHARIADMLRAIGELERELVRNPLLLTTMAVVHYNDTKLPHERVKLYKRAAEVLLKRWQRHRAGSVGLLESLGIRDRELYPALYELAYAAHDSSKGKEAADLSHEQAHKILRRHFAGLAEPLQKATAFLEYIDQTAGLLHGRGSVENPIYTFPHRTFQEYFAGTYLTKGQNLFEDELERKLTEGEYWQVAAQLGFEDLLHNEYKPSHARKTAYALCPEGELDPRNEAQWRGVLWSGLFAMEIGKEQIKQDERGGARYLARLTDNLIKLLEGGLLPHRERAEAGFVLGKLGDTRRGVCAFPLEWVALPGGRFIMGDEEDGPPHEVELSPFKISCYSVTNAQFAAFVQAGGYKEKKWWSEGGWKARQKEKWEQPYYWRDERFNLPNQPVLGVTWFEAEAFCNWLSVQMTNDNGQKTTVRLPTEAEWEYAARGTAGRIFPWGDEEPTTELANYDEKVGRTTAVGSYPAGATPEGICDLSGNVWEWCSDWYGGDYYKTCEQQGVVRNPIGPSQGESRVLRGGSWLSNPYVLRCAFRYCDEPTNRNLYFGFRCSQDVR